MNLNKSRSRISQLSEDEIEAVTTRISQEAASAPLVAGSEVAVTCSVTASVMSYQTQMKITGYVTRPLPVNKRLEIDRQILKMIVKEYLPFILLKVRNLKK